MMKNTESDLYTCLKLYGDGDIYPFHMPGHKRNPEFLDFGKTVQMDITEIEGFDNMHHARGIIDHAQRRAAGLYGADETWFLVNGSSCGLISAILGSCQRGGRILVARNCHKSVYNAIEMGNLTPVYLYPKLVTSIQICGSIQPAQVGAALEAYPDIEAVLITSPTYEGVVSDVAAIAKIVHEKRIPLIVDEAHGAHFGFSEGFPQTAVRLGADVVVQSAHKTLPSLTQTSLIHLNGDIADRRKIRKYYDYLQTTSPSYIMMASLDHCMGLLEKDHKKLFDNYRQLLSDFYNQCQALGKIKVLQHQDLDCADVFDWDMSKIVIFCQRNDACGKWLYRILLNQYHLQMEMTSRDYVLGMTSFCDKKEGFERLLHALGEIDAMDIEGFPVYPVTDLFFSDDARAQHFRYVCDAPLSAGAAAEHRTEPVDFWLSEGRISAEYAYIYPPGVPFLVPGERITGMHLNLMRQDVEAGLEVEGPEDEQLKKLKVICDN